MPPKRGAKRVIVDDDPAPMEPLPSLPHPRDIGSKLADRGSACDACGKALAHPERAAHKWVIAHVNDVRLVIRAMIICGAQDGGVWRRIDHVVRSDALLDYELFHSAGCNLDHIEVCVLLRYALDAEFRAAGYLLNFSPACAVMPSVDGAGLMHETIRIHLSAALVF
jgi:hypothetical protein